MRRLGHIWNPADLRCWGNKVLRDHVWAPAGSGSRGYFTTFIGGTGAASFIDGLASQMKTYDCRWNRLLLPEFDFDIGSLRSVACASAAGSCICPPVDKWIKERLGDEKRSKTGPCCGTGGGARLVCVLGFVADTHAFICRTSELASISSPQHSSGHEFHSPRVMRTGTPTILAGHSKSLSWTIETSQPPTSITVMFSPENDPKAVR